MITDSRLARQTAERLIGSRAQLLKFQCLLGFDGFVDEIFHVVEQRQSPTKYTPFASIKGFGSKPQFRTLLACLRVLDPIGSAPFNGE